MYSRLRFKPFVGEIYGFGTIFWKIAACFNSSFSFRFYKTQRELRKNNHCWYRSKISEKSFVYLPWRFQARDKTEQRFQTLGNVAETWEVPSSSRCCRVALCSTREFLNEHVKYRLLGCDVNVQFIPREVYSYFGKMHLFGNTPSLSSLPA